MNAINQCATSGKVTSLILRIAQWLPIKKHRIWGKAVVYLFDFDAD
jgi:hypothetical protein